jgi:phosphate transport system substrate-binding protein
MRALIEDLAATYHASYPNVLFEIRGGSSAVGLRDLLAEKADIAAVSWKTEGEPDPPGVRIAPIARDGLTILVHPSNQLRGLTTLQLRALYRGETLDWAALEGSPGEPVIISRGGIGRP